MPPTYALPNNLPHPFVPLESVPMAFIDLEMTGLDPDARIIQVAIVHLDKGKLPRVAFSSYVDPEIDLPERITKITGIRPEDLHGARTWEAVAPEVLDALHGRLVGAYNAPADYTWLRNECARVGAPAPSWPWLDVFVLAKSEQCDKYAKGDKKLATVCRRRGLAVDAHQAPGDAVATALLFRLLGTEAGVLHMRLDDFLQAQRLEALSQEEDFCRYLRSQKVTGDRPDCPWHELEGLELPDWPARQLEMGACPICQGAAVYRIAQDGAVKLETADGAPHNCDDYLPF